MGLSVIIGFAMVLRSDDGCWIVKGLLGVLGFRGLGFRGLGVLGFRGLGFRALGA